MALRKFLFLNSTEGFSEEQQATDQLELSKLTLSGVAGIAIDAGSQRITGVATPTAVSDAATKSYVDSLVQGISWKYPARAATTGALASCTYANGTAGVGATLTATANGALADQDDVTLIVDDRLLVKNQAAGLQNGLYKVTAVGDGSNPFVLTRVIDNDQASEQHASAAFVEEGTVNADSAFVQTTDGTITMGTTGLVWVLFTSTSQSTASHGLEKVGNDFRVKAGDGIDNTSNTESTNVKLDGSTPGLEFSGSAGSGALKVKPETAKGVDVESAGVFIKLPGSNPGLYFDGSGNLDAKLDSSGGLSSGASGLKAKLNGTTLTSGSSGLSVDHSPTVAGSYTASGAIGAFTGVYISGNGVISQGDCSVHAKSRIMGVASAAISDTVAGNVVRYGVVAGALSGATAGVDYYLDTDGTPVVYASLSSGARVVRLGWAYNATDLFVDPQSISKKA